MFAEMHLAAARAQLAKKAEQPPSQ
jgi:hypothetical protein